MRSRVAATATALASIASIGCSHSSEQRPLDGPDPANAPRYSDVWLLSTHNAYWVDRGVKNDSFASGTQTRLLDQLLLSRARSIEIDVHRSPGNPGRFDVYHTTPGNVLCDDLARCLSMVRAFEWALPKHEPLQITIELKELFASLWDARHTIEDFDRILRDELGDHLYTPKDFLARCDRAGTHETIAECMARKSWPGVDELRGKVIVAAMGNWDELGQAQSTSDWARYATKDDVRLRAAFPMASSWKLKMEALNDRLHDLLTQVDLDRAFAATAFLQIEDPTDANASPFIGKNGLIRIDNSFGADDQRARIAQHMQLLQTDTPWIAPDDGDVRHALHPLDGKTILDEPGARWIVAAPEKDSSIAAYATVTTKTTTTWETAVSSGASGNAWGCLRAAAAAASDADAVTVCRTKTAATSTPNVDAERAVVRVLLEKAGVSTTETYPSNDPAPDGPGDLIAVDVTIDASGSTCVQPRSAAAADRDRQPTWAPLGPPRCLASKLSFVGLFRPSTGAADGSPVLFAGLRRDGAFVDAASFDHVVRIHAADAPVEDVHAIVDASVP